MAMQQIFFLILISKFCKKLIFIFLNYKLDLGEFRVGVFEFDL